MKKLEFEVEQAFHSGVEFEGWVSMLKANIYDIQREKDPVERKAIIELAQFAYKTAEQIAKKYGVVEQFKKHQELYQCFQQLSQGSPNNSLGLPLPNRSIN